MSSIRSVSRLRPSRPQETLPRQRRLQHRRARQQRWRALLGQRPRPEEAETSLRREATSPASVAMEDIQQLLPKKKRSQTGTPRPQPHRHALPQREAPQQPLQRSPFQKGRLLQTSSPSAWHRQLPRCHRHPLSQPLPEASRVLARTLATNARKPLHRAAVGIAPRARFHEGIRVHTVARGTPPARKTWRNVTRQCVQRAAALTVMGLGPRTAQSREPRARGQWGMFGPVPTESLWGQCPETALELRLPAWQVQASRRHGHRQEVHRVPAPRQSQPKRAAPATAAQARHRSRAPRPLLLHRRPRPQQNHQRPAGRTLLGQRYPPRYRPRPRRQPFRPSSG